MTIRFLSCTNTLGAEIYANSRVSVVSSRRKIGVAGQVSRVERYFYSQNVSCDFMSIPVEKISSEPSVRTIQMLVVAAVDPWRSCFARTLAVSSLY